MCEAYRDGVAADIIRADGQVSNLQMLDAVRVVTFVQDSVLHLTILLPSFGAMEQVQRECQNALKLHPYPSLLAQEGRYIAAVWSRTHLGTSVIVQPYHDRLSD